MVCKSIPSICFSRSFALRMNSRCGPPTTTSPTSPATHRSSSGAHPSAIPAPQVLRPREARVAQDVECPRGAGAGGAVEDDLRIAGELVESVGQLAQRDVPRAVDVAGLPLERLAHV